MHHGHRNHDTSPVLAFLAGAATAVALGGYYLYGKDGPRHRKKVEHWILKAKAEILDRMRQTQDLTEEKYHRIVDEVTGRYASARDVGHERAGRAAESFKRRWQKMREASARAADEARAELEAEQSEDEALDRSDRNQGS
jgi:hypothetical protein